MGDLDRLTRQWTRSLPHHVDLVVGISPGGMLAAGLLACHLDVPSAELASLCQSRRRLGDERALTGKPRVLVVDDHARTGEALAEATARLAAAELAHEIHSGAVIVSPEAAQDGSVERFAEAVPTPWLFEWDVMHDLSSARLCVEFESVLMPSGAGAFVGPEKEIGWVVTSRPERRRFETEVWLRNHGIGYRELVMGCADLAEVYPRLGAEMLVVNGASQAARIARKAGSPVFSVESGSVMNLGDASEYGSLLSAPDPGRYLGHVHRLAVRWVRRCLLGREDLSAEVSDPESAEADSRGTARRTRVGG